LNVEGFLEQILEVVATIIRTYWVGFILYNWRRWYDPI